MAVGKQFGREATIYLAGFVGAGILQFLAIPIYSRALGPEQYGYLTLVIAATTVLSGIMIIGGDVALARFWVDAKNEEDKRILASTWIGFLTAWSVLVALAACLAAPWLASRLRPDAGLALLLTIGFVGLIPAQLSRMLAQVLRNQFRPIPFAATTVLTMSFNVTLGVLLGIALDLGVFGILLGMLLGESLGALVRLPLVKGSLGGRVSGQILRPLLNFGLPFVPASLAMWVFTGADRLVLSARGTAEELGTYGLAATLIGPFTVVTLALGQAWIPRISALYSDDPNAARRATSQALGVALGCLGSAAMLMGALAPWLVGLVAGADYVGGAAALPALALGAAFAATTPFTATGLTLLRKTRLIPVITASAAGVDAILLLVLVPPFGVIGAGVAVAGGYLTLAAGLLRSSNRVFPTTESKAALATAVLILASQTVVATAFPGGILVILATMLGGLGLLAAVFWLRRSLV